MFIFHIFTCFGKYDYYYSITFRVSQATSVSQTTDLGDLISWRIFTVTNFDQSYGSIKQLMKCIILCYIEVCIYITLWEEPIYINFQQNCDAFRLILVWRMGNRTKKTY